MPGPPRQDAPYLLAVYRLFPSADTPLGGVSAVDVAAEVDVSTRTAREHLNRLVDEDVLDRLEFRRGAFYRPLTPSANAALILKHE